jgi:hypothetical protein
MGDVPLLAHLKGWVNGVAFRRQGWLQITGGEHNPLWTSSFKLPSSIVLQEMINPVTLQTPRRDRITYENREANQIRIHRI